MPSREVFTWLIRNASSHLIDLERSEWIEKKGRKAFAKHPCMEKLFPFILFCAFLMSRKAKAKENAVGKTFFVFLFALFRLVDG